MKRVRIVAGTGFRAVVAAAGLWLSAAGGVAGAGTAADSSAATGGGAAARNPVADSSAAAVRRVPAPDHSMIVAPPLPLLLDPTDFGLGSTVVFTHLPSAAELHDLGYLPSVGHVVVSLPAWPAGWDRLQSLQQSVLPDGADLIVLLPGYPPSREAAQAWNYLRKPLRLVLVVKGPPVDREMILELNSMRALERVIADMPQPSRSGFERLQRPLSFRVVMP